MCLSCAIIRPVYAKLLFVQNISKQRGNHASWVLYCTGNKQLMDQCSCIRVFTVAGLFQSRSTCSFLRSHLVARTSVTRCRCITVIHSFFCSFVYVYLRYFAKHLTEAQTQRCRSLIRPRCPFGAACGCFVADREHWFISRRQDLWALRIFLIRKSYIIRWILAFVAPVFLVRLIATYYLSSH